MIGSPRSAISPKIAAGVDAALTRRALRGEAGNTDARLLAGGEDWTVRDVICTSGPSDRPFEEQHKRVSIAIVASGSFQYRTTTGGALLTPGSMMLGSTGRCFECGHEHASGDRCVSFHYSPERFERIAADAGAALPSGIFRVPRLPALRDTADIVADSVAGLCGYGVDWEALSVRLAARVARLCSDRPRPAAAPAEHLVRRVTEVVREIERSSETDLTLDRLAARAALSPYHFLRTFEVVTGVTPHRYVLRARLRNAAVRLSVSDDKVIDAAYDSGFSSLSTFNRAFRDEFGVSPRSYRASSPRVQSA